MTAEELEGFLSDALAGVPLDPWTAEQVLESWKAGQEAIEKLKNTRSSSWSQGDWPDF